MCSQATKSKATLGTGSAEHEAMSAARQSYLLHANLRWVLIGTTSKVIPIHGMKPVQRGNQHILCSKSNPADTPCAFCRTSGWSKRPRKDTTVCLGSFNSVAHQSQSQHSDQMLRQAMGMQDPGRQLVRHEELLGRINQRPLLAFFCKLDGGHPTSGRKLVSIVWAADEEIQIKG